MKKRINYVKNTKFKTLAIIMVSIFFLVIGVGYSYLKESLEVVGKSTIIVPSTDEVANGNSTYSWQIINSEKVENTNQIKYDIKLNIVNLDKDVNLWTILFDAPKTLNIEQSQILQGTITTDKSGHIILSSDDLNKFVANGDSLDLDLTLVLDSDENLNISNLIFNGLLLNN